MISYTPIHTRVSPSIVSKVEITKCLSLTILKSTSLIPVWNMPSESLILLPNALLIAQTLHARDMRSPMITPRIAATDAII